MLRLQLRAVTSPRIYAGVVDQWNVPLITMGGMKLSKSEGRIIPWGVLKLLDRGAVHRFCLSTAICPDDPLSVREEALDISGIGDAPYEWSWETYKEFLS